MNGDVLIWLTVAATALGVLVAIVITWPRSSGSGGRLLGMDGPCGSMQMSSSYVLRRNGRKREVRRG